MGSLTTITDGTNELELKCRELVWGAYCGILG